MRTARFFRLRLCFFGFAVQAVSLKDSAKKRRLQPLFGFTPVPFRVQGFTFIEILVGGAILASLMAAAMVMVNQGLEIFNQSQYQARATALARDRLERAHNVSYDNLGTVGGIPPGTLPAQETAAFNGGTFDIRTYVVYFDDPFDGEAPADVIPADYKRVRIEVTWDGPFKSHKPVVLWTDIAPRGIETLANAGTLSILVIDASGLPVIGAEVSINAPSLVPPVNMTAYSDAFGRVLIPGAPACTACYEISVTKSGYTTDRTYSSTEVANPNKPHASVNVSGLMDISFAIDKPATVTVRALRAGSYVPFAGVQINMRGVKEIGRTTLDEPVYKFNQNFVTSGSQGQVVISGLEWDTYFVSLPLGSSVDLAGTIPFSPVGILPDSNQTFLMAVEVASPNSLLVKILDTTSQPLASGGATLSNPGLGFIATKSAGLAGRPDWSQVFFPSLTVGQYDLSVFSEGYQTATASVQINDDRTEQFLLEAL